MNDRFADTQNKDVVIVYTLFGAVDDDKKNHPEVSVDHNICDGAYAKKYHEVRETFEALMDARRKNNDGSYGRLEIEAKEGTTHQDISVDHNISGKYEKYYCAVISAFEAVMDARRKNNDGSYGRLDIRVRNFQAG